jgi:hypothetical protein
VFVFGNPYNTVLAFKPDAAATSASASRDPQKRSTGSAKA